MSADQGSAAMEPKKFLSKEEIFAAQDIEREDVEVPEWGGWVQVKGMTGAARDRFEGSMMKEVGKGKAARQVRSFTNIRARAMALSVVKPGTDELQFTYDDAVKLGNKSAAALDRVFDVAMRLSKISNQDLEDIEGNSAQEGGDGEAGE